MLRPYCLEVQARIVLSVLEKALAYRMMSNFEFWQECFFGIAHRAVAFRIDCAPLETQETRLLYS